MRDGNEADGADIRLGGCCHNRIVIWRIAKENYCHIGALPLFFLELVTVTKGKPMSQPTIDTDECSGCGICVDVCPNGVLDIVGSVASVVSEDACNGCGECMEECPLGAIEVDED